MRVVGNRTYISVALLVLVTLGQIFGVGVDQLDPKIVVAVQTLLVGATAVFLRKAVSEK